MSDLDLLREAAAKMRERAERATRGPWHAGGAFIESHELVVDGAMPVVEFTNDAAGAANAEHIASWHPDVALAVADLLEAAASEFFGIAGRAWTDCPTARRAVQVARRALGGE